MWVSAQVKVYKLVSLVQFQIVIVFKYVITLLATLLTSRATNKYKWVLITTIANASAAEYWNI